MSCLVYCVYFTLLGAFVGIAIGRASELAKIGRLELVALDNSYRLPERGRDLDRDQEAVGEPVSLGMLEMYRIRDWYVGEGDVGKRWDWREKETIGM